MQRKTIWAFGLALLVSTPALAQPKYLPNLEQPPTAQPETKASQPNGAQPEQIAEPRQGEVIAFDPVAPASRYFARSEYLMWWVHRGPTPVLLTTAPNNGLNVNGLTGGIQGQPGTTDVFTSRNLDYHTTSGIRIAVGANLGDGFWALEADGFIIPRKTIDYTLVGNPNGTPLMTIPFLDASSGQLSALDVTAQDNFGNPYLTGIFNVRSELEFWGYELKLVAHSIRTAERNFDLFVGYRSLGLDENLTINQIITAQQTGSINLQFPGVGLGQPGGIQGYYSVPAGGVVTITDSFAARNRFYGAMAGGRFFWEIDRWTVDLTGKIAVGVTHQEVGIGGVSTATSGFLGNNPPVANLVTPGGVFALQNNSGSFSQNQFTVVPEVGVNAAYAMTSWLSFRLGYSALYWSNVARPGGQIDPVLNSKLVPTGAFAQSQTTAAGRQAPVPGAFTPGLEQGRPYFNFRDSAFWAHGMNFGIEIRY